MKNLERHLRKDHIQMCPKTKFVLVKMGKGDIAVKQQQQILDDKIDKSGCK